MTLRWCAIVRARTMNPRAGRRWWHESVAQSSQWRNKSGRRISKSMGGGPLRSLAISHGSSPALPPPLTPRLLLAHSCRCGGCIRQPRVLLGDGSRPPPLRRQPSAPSLPWSSTSSRPLHHLRHPPHLIPLPDLQLVLHRLRRPLHPYCVPAYPPLTPCHRMIRRMACPKHQPARCMVLRTTSSPHQLHCICRLNIKHPASKH